MAALRSDLVNLDDIIKGMGQHGKEARDRRFFNIPIYQRLYVWGREQVRTLLEDVWAACLAGKEIVYLGGTLVIERERLSQDARLLDLIDGQQRFTTLWLISIALGEDGIALIDYRRDLVDGKPHPRIRFAIRPAVQEFFSKRLNGEDMNLADTRQIQDALDEVKSFFMDLEGGYTPAQARNMIADFIRHKVKLVLTQVPENTDLNKLFEVINNRAVQLQHHDLLKARLLKMIDAGERELYSQLWDACAHMNDYVERNLRLATGVDLVTVFEEGERPSGNGGAADVHRVLSALRNKIKPAQECDALSLGEILRYEGPAMSDSNKEGGTPDDEKPDKVRSIISFSMLLQHVLRIGLAQKRTINGENADDITRISDKELLAIFNSHFFCRDVNSSDAKRFIETLWQVRYVFDMYIIKWVIIEETKIHAIRQLYINANNGSKYLQRHTSDAMPSFALLQSMLYHSQQLTTQYWLTPLLNYLLSYGAEGVELYLQHLDNHLFCTRAGDAPLIERTRRFLDAPWHHETLVNIRDEIGTSQELGTGFRHYWFYKLEYLLARELATEQAKDFRITAKNSVEHIAPQKPEFSTDRVAPNLLHTFGNLALVSRGINSELSNKGFAQKRADFKARYSGKGVSLKLERVFKNETWGDDQIRDHQKAMEKVFNDYFAEIMRSVMKSMTAMGS